MKFLFVTLNILNDYTCFIFIKFVIIKFVEIKIFVFKNIYKKIIFEFVVDHDNNKS